MERDSLHGIDRPLSLSNIPYSRNPFQEPFLSRSYWNFSPSNISSNSKGLLRAPPLSLIHSAPFLLQPPPQQPPLLPLPASLPRRSSSCPVPSFSPAIKNVSRKSRNHAFTPKKSTKSSSTKNNIPKNEADKKSWDSVTVSSTNKLRREQPKKLGEDDTRSVGFSTMSPPPSSLPLPTFSLRPKLRTDAGATDDLRRLLRLQ